MLITNSRLEYIRYKIVCGAFQRAGTSARLQVAARIASIGIGE
ncbi:MAG TPA: hypothetical protein VNZ48_18810 [Xanthobacteraceae bacterium]|jgi:hypothetical protein|nr:hypothetical protein [Xanthobacteraceae bacterium]